MSYTPDLVAELEILRQYDLDNHLAGLKVHHDADQGTIAATRRLHDKGLLSQPDGGYLTSLGRDAAEHAQALLTILRTADRAG
ncbi:TIGR02647 family protein [Stutzerimonas azotifigens]|uniref:TIGR02647 family protein n=1 Tax=Stutzerimonas azotifigens TaxID=291995 RepID=UPI00041B37E8|nr:TIGR02647 family protein [Stutzerimonas azotifigens]